MPAQRNCLRLTHDREPPSGRLKPGAAILIVGIALVFLSLSAATTWGAVDYFSRAQEYFDEGDLRAARIELKNAFTTILDELKNMGWAASWLDQPWQASAEYLGRPAP